jgi:hypothetical protein
MPKYIVVHTTLHHGRKGEKSPETYLPGERVDLTEKEAGAIGSNVHLDTVLEKHESRGEKEKK